MHIQRGKPQRMAFEAREVALRNLNEELEKRVVDRTLQLEGANKELEGQLTAWLVERFPDAVLVDVLGLVKLVDRKEIEANDWSVTPGRYVGTAPEVVDEDFDLEQTLRDIHIELDGLNDEATSLAATIAKHFRELMG